MTDQVAAPVALFLFNRPEAAARVFAEIRRARPKRLLLVGDAARPGRAGEAEAVERGRALARQVDWPCELLTNFAAENLGCKRRLASGLDWVFAHAEEAILLEDDCVPHPDFFPFCEAMLAKYRDDERVMMACGTNFLIEAPGLNESYFFADYYPIWGWATWRRAWRHYDAEIRDWPALRESGQLEWLFGSVHLANYYGSLFDLVRAGFDTWDIQWWFACIFQRGLAVVPRTNLIANIGLEGAHTKTQGRLHTGLPTRPVGMDNLRHPARVIPDRRLCELTYQRSHADLDFRLRDAIRRGKLKNVVKLAAPGPLRRAIRAAYQAWRRSRI